jgi:hypothetical protein
MEYLEKLKINAEKDTLNSRLGWQSFYIFNISGQIFGDIMQHGVNPCQPIDDHFPPAISQYSRVYTINLPISCPLM